MRVFQRQQALVVAGGLCAEGLVQLRLALHQEQAADVLQQSCQQQCVGLLQVQCLAQGAGGDCGNQAAPPDAFVGAVQACVAAQVAQQAEAKGDLQGRVQAELVDRLLKVVNPAAIGKQR